MPFPTDGRVVLGLMSGATKKVTWLLEAEIESAGRSGDKKQPRINLYLSVVASAATDATGPIADPLRRRVVDWDELTPDQLWRIAELRLEIDHWRKRNP
jgi:hypothetical protein